MSPLSTTVSAAMPMASPLLTRPGEVEGLLGTHVDRLAEALPALRAAALGTAA